MNCRICGSDEPYHAHDGDKLIPDYFTIGRGQTEFEAAQAWKLRHQRTQRALMGLVALADEEVIGTLASSLRSVGLVDTANEIDLAVEKARETIAAHEGEKAE